MSYMIDEEDVTCALEVKKYIFDDSRVFYTVQIQQAFFAAVNIEGPPRTNTLPNNPTLDLMPTSQYLNPEWHSALSFELHAVFLLQIDCVCVFLMSFF